MGMIQDILQIVDSHKNQRFVSNDNCSNIKTPFEEIMEVVAQKMIIKGNNNSNDNNNNNSKISNKVLITSAEEIRPEKKQEYKSTPHLNLWKYDRVSLHSSALHSSAPLYIIIEELAFLRELCTCVKGQLREASEYHSDITCTTPLYSQQYSNTGVCDGSAELKGRDEGLNDLEGINNKINNNNGDMFDTGAILILRSINPYFDESLKRHRSRLFDRKDNIQADRTIIMNDASKSSTKDVVYELLTLLEDSLVVHKHGEDEIRYDYAPELPGLIADTILALSQPLLMSNTIRIALEGRLGSAVSTIAMSTSQLTSLSIKVSDSNKVPSSFSNSSNTSIEEFNRQVSADMSGLAHSVSIGWEIVRLLVRHHHSRNPPLLLDATRITLNAAAISFGAGYAIIPALSPIERYKEGDSNTIRRITSSFSISDILMAVVQGSSSSLWFTSGHWVFAEMLSVGMTVNGKWLGIMEDTGDMEMGRGKQKYDQHRDDDNNNDKNNYNSNRDSINLHRHHQSAVETPTNYQNGGDIGPINLNGISFAPTTTASSGNMAHTPFSTPQLGSNNNNKDNQSEIMALFQTVDGATSAVDCDTATTEILGTMTTCLRPVLSHLEVLFSKVFANSAEYAVYIPSFFGGSIGFTETVVTEILYKALCNLMLALPERLMTPQWWSGAQLCDIGEGLYNAASRGIFQRVVDFMRETGEVDIKSLGSRWGKLLDIVLTALRGVTVENNKSDCQNRAGEVGANSTLQFTSRVNDLWSTDAAKPYMAAYCFLISAFHKAGQLPYVLFESGNEDTYKGKGARVVCDFITSTQINTAFTPITGVHDTVPYKHFGGRGGESVTQMESGIFSQYFDTNTQQPTNIIHEANNSRANEEWYDTSSRGIMAPLEQKSPLLQVILRRVISLLSHSNTEKDITLYRGVLSLLSILLSLDGVESSEQQVSQRNSRCCDYSHIDGLCGLSVADFTVRFVHFILENADNNATHPYNWRLHCAACDFVEVNRSLFVNVPYLVGLLLSPKFLEIAISNTISSYAVAKKIKLANCLSVSAVLKSYSIDIITALAHHAETAYSFGEPANALVASVWLQFVRYICTSLQYDPFRCFDDDAHKAVVAQRFVTCAAHSLFSAIRVAQLTDLSSDRSIGFGDYPDAKTALYQSLEILEVMVAHVPVFAASLIVPVFGGLCTSTSSSSSSNAPIASRGAMTPVSFVFGLLCFLFEAHSINLVEATSGIIIDIFIHNLNEVFQQTKTAMPQSVRQSFFSVVSHRLLLDTPDAGNVSNHAINTYVFIVVLHHIYSFDPTFFYAVLQGVNSSGDIPMLDWFYDKLVEIVVNSSNRAEKAASLAFLSDLGLDHRVRQKLLPDLGKNDCTSDNDDKLEAIINIWKGLGSSPGNSLEQPELYCRVPLCELLWISQLVKFDAKQVAIRAVTPSPLDEGQAPLSQSTVPISRDISDKSTQPKASTKSIFTNFGVNEAASIKQGHLSGFSHIVDRRKTLRDILQHYTRVLNWQLSVVSSISEGDAVEEYNKRYRCEHSHMSDETISSKNSLVKEPGQFAKYNTSNMELLLNKRSPGKGDNASSPERRRGESSFHYLNESILSQQKSLESNCVRTSPGKRPSVITSNRSLLGALLPYNAISTGIDPSDSAVRHQMTPRRNHRLHDIKKSLVVIPDDFVYEEHRYHVSRCPLVYGATYAVQGTPNDVTYNVTLSTIDVGCRALSALEAAWLATNGIEGEDSITSNVPSEDMDYLAQERLRTVQVLFDIMALCRPYSKLLLCPMESLFVKACEVLIAVLCNSWSNHLDDMSPCSVVSQKALNVLENLEYYSAYTGIVWPKTLHALSSAHVFLEPSVSHRILHYLNVLLEAHATPAILHQKAPGVMNTSANQNKSDSLLFTSGATVSGESRIIGTVILQVITLVTGRFVTKKLEANTMRLVSTAWREWYNTARLISPNERYLYVHGQPCFQFNACTMVLIGVISKCKEAAYYIDRETFFNLFHTIANDFFTSLQNAWHFVWVKMLTLAEALFVAAPDIWGPRLQEEMLQCMRIKTLVADEDSPDEAAQVLRLLSMVCLKFPTCDAVPLAIKAFSWVATSNKRLFGTKRVPALNDSLTLLVSIPVVSVRHRSSDIERFITISSSNSSTISLRDIAKLLHSLNARIHVNAAKIARAADFDPDSLSAAHISTSTSRRSQTRSSSRRSPSPVFGRSGGEESMHELFEDIHDTSIAGHCAISQKLLLLFLNHWLAAVMGPSRASIKEREKLIEIREYLVKPLYHFSEKYLVGGVGVIREDDGMDRSLVKLLKFMKMVVSILESTIVM